MDSSSQLLATQAAQITLLKAQVSRLNQQLIACEQFMGECRGVVDRAGLGSELLLRLQTRADELSSSCRGLMLPTADDGYESAMSSNPVVAAQREQQITRHIDSTFFPLADAWVDARLSGDRSNLARAVAEVFEGLSQDMNATPGFYGSGDTYAPDQYVSYIRRQLLDSCDSVVGGVGGPPARTSDRTSGPPRVQGRRPPPSDRHARPAPVTRSTFASGGHSGVRGVRGGATEPARSNVGGGGGRGRGGGDWVGVGDGGGGWDMIDEDSSRRPSTRDSARHGEGYDSWNLRDEHSGGVRGRRPEWQ